MLNFLRLCTLTVTSALILTACNLNTDRPGIITPTAADDLTPLVTASPTETVTPTATMSPQPTEELVQIIEPTRLPTQGPPTVPPPPAGTAEPYVHVIAEQDTLGFIIQKYDYVYPRDIDVFNEIVRINDNMFSPDILPPAGSEILIPRQTPTPIPVGIEMTATSDAALGLGERVGDIALPAGSNAGCHDVEEGDTIVGIAETYDTTLEIISQLNPNLNWFGCVFTEYSGGPNCGPSIQIGQCINVPMPTPVPTNTATPSGSETATPTPTYPAPRAVFPPDGSTVAPGIFSLQWVSVGQLKASEQYLVEVENTVTGDRWVQVTRSTSITLPSSLIPGSGEPAAMQWRVIVAMPDTQGAYAYIGGEGRWRSFTWQSQ